MMVARRAELGEIERLRQDYRRQARCQIVRDSILGRGLADPYVVVDENRPVAYAGVWNAHFIGRLMEFHVVPDRRREAPEMLRAVLAVSGATRVEAQTNMPLMLEMLGAFGGEPATENILFEEGDSTTLPEPSGCAFRRRRDGDEGPEGRWVVERAGRVVAAGGVLGHYNPPYGDLYMEVVDEARRRGIGSYLVQQLRSVCLDAGVTPAARCDPTNEASRRTLERGGLRVCGRLLAADLTPRRA